MGNFEINLDPPPPSGGVVEIRGGGPSRGVLAIVACLVIVVVLVVAVGRSRDKTIAEPSTTTSLFEPTTTTTDGSSTTTSTTSEPETTTTVAAVQVVGPLLPEKTGASLVIARLDGRLVQLDVDSGTITDLAPGQRLRNIYQILVLKDGVVLSGDRSPSYVTNGEVTSLQRGVDQVLGSPDGSQVIGVSYSEAAARVVSFLPSGERGPAINLPPQSDPVSLVPGGIVLQARAGGVYRFDLADGSTSKIADGIFVAIAGDRVASMTCDDTLKCSIGLGPLGKRPQHQVAVPEPFSWYFAQGGDVLSPTRDLIAYETNVQGRYVVAVLDLDTGSVLLSVNVSTGPQGSISPLVWSPDGRWLFWVDVGKVKAWSPDGGGDPVEFANSDAGAALVIAASYVAA
ncbi:MAG: hypothetical protein ABJD24_12370 [Acidimicrobiales bacterium]